MQLPSTSELVHALIRLRNSKGWEQKDIAKRSHTSGGKPLTEDDVGHFERQKTQLNYDRLVKDILPAYGVADFDTFLDFCRGPSLADIRIIQTDDFSSSRITKGILDLHVSPDVLGPSRTRIDWITLEPGSETSWGAHDGHEFVLVLVGTVKCEFASEEKGPRQEHMLTRGMAVAFPGALFHRFLNPAQKPAKVVSGRPAHSGTAWKSGRG